MPTYWSGIGIAANIYVKSFSEVSVPAGQNLVTGSVVNGKSLAGTSSMLGKTGVFIPTATLSGWFTAGSGVVMSEGAIATTVSSIAKIASVATMSTTSPSLTISDPILGEP